MFDCSCPRTVILVWISVSQRYIIYIGGTASRTASNEGLKGLVHRVEGGEEGACNY